jgi:HEAT repeat protein
MHRIAVGLLAVVAWCIVAPSAIAQIEDSVANLIKNLAEKDEETRIEACKALGRKGPKAKKAVPALADALADPSEEVRGFALDALSKIGDASLDALPAIQKALAHDKSPLIRSLAAETIGSFGAKAKDAVPALVKALKDEDGNVQTRALHALGKIGPQVEGVRPALLAALAEPGLAGVAAASLARLGKDALPDLTSVLDGKDETARVHAVLALRVIGGEAIVPLLIKALKDSSAEVRSQAIDSLGRLGELARPALPRLLELLADKDAGEAAAVAVARFRKDALPGVVSFLNHADEHARLHAVLALRQIGLPDVAAPLASALADKSPKVRLQAVEALGTLGKDATSAVPALEKLANDPDEDVKKAVASLLERLKS